MQRTCGRQDRPFHIGEAPHEKPCVCAERAPEVFHRIACRSVGAPRCWPFGQYLPSHSYTLAEHYTLTVGANNIFDTYPDRIAASPTNPIYALTDSLADGQIFPRSGGPFGINGGFYYVRLRVTY